ncbi:MAG: hypothetical protein ACREHG_07435 [Candidatus Saccharimonadales bacterium]
MEVGATYKSSLNVVDESGAAENAASAVLTVTLPDQTTETPTPTNDVTGTYYVNYVPAQEGLYRFNWVTTTPATAQTDYVNATVFRSVVGLNDAKTFVNFDSGSNEAILRMMMASVTELIEEIVGTCVIRTFTNETITGHTVQVLRMPHAPLPDDQSITSIQSVWNGGPVWTNANNELIVYPDSATVELASFLPFYFGPWRATYKAGRTIISNKIQLAALEAIYDLWATQRPYGLDSLEPSPDDTARWETMVNTYKLPPHSVALLSGEEMPGFR